MATSFNKYSIQRQSYVLDLATTKQYLRVDHSYDDGLINECISGSLDATEAYLGFPVSSCSMAATYSVGWSINIGPFLADVDSVEISGSYFTDWTAEYRDGYTYVDLNSLPTGSPNAVIRFHTGDTQPPSHIKLALRKYVADQYETRVSEIMGVSVAKSSYAWENMLAPYKRHNI